MTLSWYTSGFCGAGICGTMVCGALHPSMDVPPSLYSPFATIIAEYCFQTCSVEPFLAYASGGMPTYDIPRTAKCRIEVVKTRVFKADGEIMTVRSTRIIFPTTDAITDKDRITIADAGIVSPLIARIRVGYDIFGLITHKEVDQ